MSERPQLCSFHPDDPNPPVAHRVMQDGRKLCLVHWEEFQRKGFVTDMPYDPSPIVAHTPGKPVETKEPASMKHADKLKQQERIAAIDWRKVEIERNSGVRVEDLAKKYGVSAFTVYSKTNGKFDGRKEAKPKPSYQPKYPSKTNGHATDGDLNLADLIAERDKLNVVIEFMQERAARVK